MRSVEYPKTENLYARDPDTMRLITRHRSEEPSLIARWFVTEKIDGTNMRLLYDPSTGEVEVRGRSDRANIARDLEATMLEMCPVDALERVFGEFVGSRDGTVTIFGEGYGAGIQGGGDYSPTKTFAAFDIMYHWPDGKDSWCNPSTSWELFAQLGVSTVPTIPPSGTGVGLDNLRSHVHELMNSGSRIGGGASEGVVARTDPYLFGQNGSRVMFKLKCADLLEVEEADG